MKRKRTLIILIVLLILSLATFLLYVKEESKHKIEERAFNKMKNAEEYIFSHITSLSIPIEEEDINNTGLVGPEFTELTSTPGTPEAKRSTLNPETAVMVVRMLKEAGVKNGDTIAIGASGSYPGFVIAALTASSAMELDVRLILSLGSSMYGGTRVEYNIFDMIHDLRASGEADFNLIALSRGYNEDKGGSLLEGILYEGTRELSLSLCEEASKKEGCILINEENLEKSIEKRLELFGDDITLFMNVGGAPVNIGDGTIPFEVPSGVVKTISVPECETRGLTYEYLAKGIPIINLLDSKGLAEKYGIEFDPFPFPTSLKRNLKEKIYFSISIVSFITLIAILLLEMLKGKQNENK